MEPPLWLTPVTLLLGIGTWSGVHWILKSKEINMSLSRMIMIEMVPSFVFAVTTLHLLIPAIHYLLLAERIGWVSSTGTAGITWRLATFVGAAALSLSPLAWISLLEDETSSSPEEPIEDDAGDVPEERAEGDAPEERPESDAPEEREEVSAMEERAEIEEG